MKRSTPALLLGLALAFFAGLAIGRYAVPMGRTRPQVVFSSPIEEVKKESLLPRVVTSTRATSTRGKDAGADDSSPDAILAALKNIMARPADRRGYREASKMIDGLDPKNIRPILEAFAALPERREKSFYLAMLIGRWAEGDPQAAVAFAQSNGTASDRRLTVSAAIRSWAEKDATAANAFVLQMPGARSGFRR